jgi:O-antigen ligase
LDTVVTIGIFGFIPVLIFMIRPLVLFFLRDYRGLDSSEQTLVGLFVSFLFFAVLHNFMESGMLRGMSPIWTFGLLAILYMSTLNARLKGTASP